MRLGNLYAGSLLLEAGSSLQATGLFPAKPGHPTEQFLNQPTNGDNGLRCSGSAVQRVIHTSVLHTSKCRFGHPKQLFFMVNQRSNQDKRSLSTSGHPASPVAHLPTAWIHLTPGVRKLLAGILPQPSVSPLLTKWESIPNK